MGFLKDLLSDWRYFPASSSSTDTSNDNPYMMEVPLGDSSVVLSAPNREELMEMYDDLMTDEEIDYDRS